MRNLPKHYSGEPVDVERLPTEQRHKYGLASPDSIIECVSDQNLVYDAVDYAYEKGIIGLDTETSGLNIITDKIVLIQLGDIDRQYLIWADTVDVTPIVELLGDADVAKIGTNLKYDLNMFRVAYGKAARARNVVDTQLMEAILNCGLMGDVGQATRMTSLDSQVRRWLGLQLPKDLELRTGWERMEPGNWETFRDGTPIPRGEAKRFYAADDVIMPFSVAKKQKPWIEELELIDTVNLEHRLLPVLVEQETWGLKMDWERWSELAKEAEKELENATAELDEIFEVTKTYRVDAAGNTTITRDKNYGSSNELADCISEYMLREHGIVAICNNRQFREALEDAGVAKARLDKLFVQKLVPNPRKPGKNMQVGYPDMTDILAEYWEDAAHLLPENSIALTGLDSKMLRLMEIIWETDPDERDPALPSTVGLPPRLVGPILRYREFEKKLGTYGWNWEQRISPVTGRLHVDVRQAYTSTGRISTVPATQNFPGDSRYRDCFVAAPGYKYVSADYSQIEPRIIAEMSLDPTYMRVFWSAFPGTDGFEYWCGDEVTEPLDLYVEVGKLVGIIPKHLTLDDCKGDNATEEGLLGRKQAKVIVLGLGYGTGKNKFWITIMLDIEEHRHKYIADDMFDGYWNTVSRVRDLLNHLSRLAHPEKSERRVWHPLIREYVTWAESLGGRKRFFRPDSKAHYTEARNQPIQATGSDILKTACVRVTDRLWELDIDAAIVITAHDEIVVETEEIHAETVREILNEEMEIVGQYFCEHVPIVAEAVIADKWEG